MHRVSNSTKERKKTRDYFGELLHFFNYFPMSISMNCYIFPIHREDLWDY